jgi:hypothetical protein
MLQRGEEKDSAHRACNKHVERMIDVPPCADEGTTDAASKLIGRKRQVLCSYSHDSSDSRFAVESIID